MSNVGPTYYVDPFEFLALGALAQSPDMTMARRALMKHLRSLCRIARPAAVINGLEEKGLIEFPDGRNYVTLNELGALARREDGHENVPTFMTVPDAFAAPHWAFD